MIIRPERLERGHPFRQWKTWKLPGTRLSLTGCSRANDKTFFHVPELKLALDAGLVEGRQVDTVLLTHTHLDHSKDLDFLATRPTGVDIYVPEEALPYVRRYLRATTELNQVAAFAPALAAEARVHGVRPGQEFSFGRHDSHTVRIVQTEHKVPSVGYGVAENRRALLPEMEELKATLDPAEFGRLIAGRRRQGIAVDRQVQRPLFAYLGDTHADALGRSRWIFDYPVIITECTYLDDAELERARRVGHTVWSRLRPYVQAHPDTLFVLTHFSLRYSDREVLAFFERENLTNVLVWAHPESHLPEQHQH
ncbi:MBL fold metallo-hydrolase [Nonomuraea muscovyensis]|uniref:Ribonuclease Z n=1 Tax=Nonomuraea muscovyensis TaxID=1124761 RepID=A0A7X0EZA6_9ACTN|nr:MBL fold metallo-hydrolase [Nonomuraea muscovyensis]MBB6346536.1 ribonuclease Z [Nonomuraea muscovyensis]